MTRKNKLDADIETGTDLQVLSSKESNGIDRYRPKRLHILGEPISHEEVEYMKAAAMAGASPAEIADVLGIDRRTFNKWLEEKPHLAREWKAATAAGRISVKRTIFEMGMRGKFQAAAMSAVNLTDFSFGGRSVDNEEAAAAENGASMDEKTLLEKMAEEINKLPQAQRAEFTRMLESGVIETPCIRALGLSEDSGRSRQVQTEDGDSK